MNAFVSAQLEQWVLEYLSGHAVVTCGGWGTTGHVLAPEELVKEAKDSEMLVICYEPIDEYVLSHLPKLKFISCTRGGMENIQKEAVLAHPDVTVCNAPGRNANAVADLTVGLMLDSARNISLSNHYIRNQDWEHVKWFKAGKLGKKMFMGYELRGKTLGLIGFGQVGRRVAKRVSGFEMNVLVYDPYCEAKMEGVTNADLHTVLACSDFISLHCKLGKETENMINAQTIAQMKPTAFLINTARGGLVKEEDLCQALKEHRIAGAALDTLAVEPMDKNHPFLELENVVITPHIGGASYDIQAQQSEIVFEDIRAFIEGRRPPHVWL